jgi:hypothetical protein
MKDSLLVIAFIGLTVLCWGMYGPVLHRGQEAMRPNESVKGSRLRPLICVGVAYFVIAVIAPVVLLQMFGDQMGEGGEGYWTFSGTFWSLAAGAAGAIGALGIILAFFFGGKPTYVMPLVFGCAPVVNAFLTIYWGGRWKDVSPWFLSGLILVAIGAFMVLFFSPKAPPHAARAVHVAPSTTTDSANT